MSTKRNYVWLWESYSDTERIVSRFIAKLKKHVLAFDKYGEADIKFVSEGTRCFRYHNVYYDGEHIGVIRRVKAL